MSLITARLGSVSSASRAGGDPADAATGGPDSRCDAQATDGWHYALEQSAAGGEARGVAHDVARVWVRHGLKPHRLERYMASTDPDFEAKAADIIGFI